MKTTVSLVLGSGGARGYSHIGVIEELNRRGYEIVCIAGSSMGALIGGIYAAGRLEEYRDWVISLKRIDVFKLMDLTLRGEGTIRGDRLLLKLREIVGNPLIEELPITYTAVATDLTHQKEVWFQKGSMLDAIRASIAVPGFFTPVIEEGRLLVDGGVLNPIPIIPTVAAHADLIVAVDLNADVQRNQTTLPITHYLERSGFSDEWEYTPDAQKQALNHRGQVKTVSPKAISRFDVLFNSVEVMQASLGKYKVAGYPPDQLIGIPKNACRFYEFHRAKEMIELGRLMAQESLIKMEKKWC
ncbi:patatin-like phospholipase family protein [Amphritea sp. 1_MG-2023]|uniref:patatin-like phospholipase family protein n=1 Tax=Amphritea sp. 1_MG-2023 TaxID=3062670 RepID=UPI0026E3D272|nr:patatin-like phospholipase family protein [Amphritea sp. 1_MG-2023]MDO6563456.1 patatin-like phospholipase family protein [Amphritea sp. 1_MG-2023]